MKIPVGAHQMGMKMGLGLDGLKNGGHLDE